MTTGAATWQDVVERLEPQRSYWLGTVSSDGAPHATPSWGAVVDDTLYFYTERATVRSRNLAADPRIVVHLPDCEDVVIVNGRADDLGHPSVRPDVVGAFGAKYTRPDDRAFLPLADPAFDVLYALRPLRALLWRLDDYDGSQRRWRDPDA